MKLEQDSLQKIKNYTHAVQGALIFLAWVLTIAVFTRPGSSDGRTGWYFALCWLSVPILIYLVMVPMWSRAQRFANVYAFATLDVLSAVLWLSAWAAVASYVSAGKGKGKNDTARGCDNFAYGSAGKCELSQATIVLGVFLMLLFIGTSFISFRSLTHFRRTGTLPSATNPNDFATQTKDAFSSTMPAGDVEEEHDLDARTGAHPAYEMARHEDDDEYGLLHQVEQEDFTQPRHHGLGVSFESRGGDYASGDYDTSYRGAYGERSPP